MFCCASYPINSANFLPSTGGIGMKLVKAERLGKAQLHARQISARGGELFCTAAGERVRIGGRAAFYMAGTIELS